MAQRTEKEETEFKVPETLTLCVNNCGVTGNPATNNMCQKCFNATTASSSTSSSSSSPSQSQSSSSSASSSVPTPTVSSVLTFTAEKKPRSPPPRSPERSNNSSTFRKHGSTYSASSTSTTPSTESATRREVNRCSGCRRKVGLTGFRCRCGELFCAEHRYSDRHDCSYDYKAAGREAIARENPVVKAAKIVRV